MVAIVSGTGLGLNLSSLATLGRQGSLGNAAQGRSGEQVFARVSFPFRNRPATVVLVREKRAARMSNEHFKAAPLAEEQQPGTGS